MHRRAMILTVAAAGIAVPLGVHRAAWAQTASGSVADMDEDDIKMMIAANSLASLQSSQMAVQQANDPLVKEFARLEAEEQQNTMAAMKAMGESPSEATVPDDKKAAMQRLQSAQGAEFDELFVNTQTTAHQELLALHQNLLEKAGNESRESVIPLLSVPAIKSHIAMLQLINQNIGSSTASSR